MYTALFMTISKQLVGQSF